MKFTICNIQFEFYKEPIKYDPMRYFKKNIDERLDKIEKLVVNCNNAANIKLSDNRGLRDG